MIRRLPVLAMLVAATNAALAAPARVEVRTPQFTRQDLSVVRVGLPTDPGLPIREAPQAVSIVKPVADGPITRPTVPRELDLLYWLTAPANAMRACAGSAVDEPTVRACLATVRAAHARQCTTPTTAMCTDTTYLHSWCGRVEAAANWNNTSWTCSNAARAAATALDTATTLATPFGALDLTTKTIAVPRTVTGPSGTTTNVLVREQGRAAIEPNSRYFEWDGFVSVFDPAYEVLRGLTPPAPTPPPPPTTPPTTPPATPVYSTHPPPDRFFEHGPSASIASCGEAAAEHFHDFTVLEDDAREVDRQRSPRFLVDRILYGGPRGAAGNRRPLVSTSTVGGNVVATADFRDMGGQAIPIGQSYSSWRDRVGNGRTFKNLYWLIDRERGLVFNGTTSWYRDQLRRFYATNLTWQRRMREALNPYLPEELERIKLDQKMLLEKYQQYLRLKATADCVDPPPPPNTAACSAECLDALQTSVDTYGITFTPGGNPRAQRVLTTRFDDYPAYARPGAGVVSQTFNSRYRDEVWGGDPRLGDPHAPPNGEPPETDPQPLPPLPPADPVDPEGFAGPRTLSPAAIDPDDPFGRVSNRACLGQCRAEMQLYAQINRLRCQSPEVRAQAAVDAADFFAREIEPELAHGRALGCVPAAANEQTPTVCDWDDEQLVTQFERMYVAPRLAYWNRCVDEFGDGPLATADFRDRFLDPDHAPPMFASLPAPLKQKIRGYRAFDYLANPASMWRFLTDFNSYAREVAQAVFGEGGVLGGAGRLSQSTVEEKTIGNDFVGMSMRVIGAKRQALGESMCDAQVDASSDTKIQVYTFGAKANLADAVFGAASLPAQPGEVPGVRSGFTFDASIGETFVFEPGDAEEGIPERNVYTATFAVKAGYRIVIDLFRIPFPLGPLQGELAGGVGMSFDLGVHGSYVRRTTILPEDPSGACTDKVEHTTTIGAAPAVGADFFMSASAGTPGPVSLQIGIEVTITLIQLAFEMVHQMYDTNHGVANTDLLGDTSSSNGYNELMLTLLAGSIALFVDVKIAFLRFRLFEFIIARFGGFRIPASYLGSTLEGVNQCIVGELELLNMVVHEVPSDCPCVFRPLSYCPGTP